MRYSTTVSHKKEKGFGTLTISVIILTLITLVTLFTMQTSRREQQVSANQHRSDQALSAANAALDYAIAYYMSSPVGADKVDNITKAPPPDGVLDYIRTDSASVTIVDVEGVEGELSVNAEAYFEHDLDSAGNEISEAIKILGIGHSDDQSAIRKIQVKVADISLFGKGNGGPDYPLISRDSTNLSGNVNIINRFSHKAIWTGSDELNWGSGETFLAHPDYTFPADPEGYNQRVSLDTTNAFTMNGSEKSTGINSDVISNDPNLLNLTTEPDGEGFFRNFFLEPKEQIKNYAIDDEQFWHSDVEWQTLVDKPVGGLVWIEGNWSPGGTLTTLGTNDIPIILIVNGNFITTGTGAPGFDIIGMLYVTGNWETSGNIEVKGSVVVEGIVDDGNGNPTVVFDPTLFGKGSGGDPLGVKGVVAGTWKDWE